MSVLSLTLDTALATLRDVLPIAAVLLGFQVVVLRRRPANLKRVTTGFALVLLGLTLFLVGLETALFPLGESMAQQLTAPSFIGRTDPAAPVRIMDYVWVYVFAACIAFATTIAEPALLAVALKAEQMSGGALRALGLRLAVACGVAFGVALGTFRIVTGLPLSWFIMAGYVIVILLTAVTARAIIPLAYDSGGVTTSTVTVPILAALGLGLASTIPDRSPLIDGFGLIAFAALFPIIAVMGYATVTAWWNAWRKRRATNENSPPTQEVPS